MKHRLGTIVIAALVVLYGVYAVSECIAVKECREVNAVEDCPGGDPPGF